MKVLFDLQNFNSTLPVWSQILIAVFLVLYSLVSIYGRINTNFGSKAFSRIQKSQLRTNKSHIIRYTIIPFIVTLGYLWVLFKQYV